MFTIWGLQIDSTPYIPGSIRAQRRVEKVEHVHPPHQVNPHHTDPDLHNMLKSGTSYPSRIYRQVEKKIPKREPAILGKQIMKFPVVSLSPLSSLAEAWELFKTRRFRHIPVLSLSGKLVGILSDRDVLRHIAEYRPDWQSERSLGSAERVEDVMTPHVLTAHPDTEIRAIARVLFEERIGAMPFVDSAGTVVGILTRSDILRTVMNQVPFELWI